MESKSLLGCRINQLSTPLVSESRSVGAFYQAGQTLWLPERQRGHILMLHVMPAKVYTKANKVCNTRKYPRLLSKQFSAGYGCYWNHLSCCSSLNRRKTVGGFHVTMTSFTSNAGSKHGASNEGQESDSANTMIWDEPEGPYHRLVGEDPTMGMSAKVEDYMTRDPICFPKGMPLREAAQIFLERGFGGAPVVEPYEGDTYGRGQLVGVLSRKDLIWKETGHRNEADSMYKMPFYWNYLNAGPMMENLRKQVMKIMSTTVEDSMNASPVSVDVSTPISEAAEMMLNGQISRLPVVAPRADGKPGKTVVGILTGNDILKHVMLLL